MQSLAMNKDTEQLTQWLITQPNLMATVADASRALGWPEDKTTAVAADSYWLFLDTVDGVPHVIADGE